MKTFYRNCENVKCSIVILKDSDQNVYKSLYNYNY